MAVAIAAVQASSLPSVSDIQCIPLAMCGSYELTEVEVETLRGRIYALNKAHVRGWRWRTARIGAAKPGRFNLLVWRIR